MIQNQMKQLHHTKASKNFIESKIKVPLDLGRKVGAEYTCFTVERYWLLTA